MDSDLTDPAYVDGRAYRPRHVGPTDPTIAFITPVAAPTLSPICDIEDPISIEPYDRSPRGARRAETIFEGQELEMLLLWPRGRVFIFDDVRYRTAANESFYQVVCSAYRGVVRGLPQSGYNRHKEGLCLSSRGQQMDSQRDGAHNGGHRPRSRAHRGSLRWTS